MLLMNEWKLEKETMHALAQMLGKYKLASAYQEPQWAHVVLDITVHGFSTGLLTFESHDYQLSVNLVKHQLEIIADDEEYMIPLADGTTIKSYFEQARDYLKSKGVTPEINTLPQEVSDPILFEEDTQHHHYDEQKAKQALSLMKTAYRAESKFVNPLRTRKVKAGLFWGTFDVSCILVYNDHEPFPDDTKVIERGAFDEPMIEFGFWFGDDKFEGPTYFVLAYPFAERKFECPSNFPEGSRYDESMAEFIFELKDVQGDVEEQLVQFFEAAYYEFKDYLKWQGCDHYHLPLKMRENHAK